VDPDELERNSQPQGGHANPQEVYDFCLVLFVIISGKPISASGLIGADFNSGSTSALVIATVRYSPCECLPQFRHFSDWSITCKRFCWGRTAALAIHVFDECAGR
jgi:hypothetical protein